MNANPLEGIAMEDLVAVKGYISEDYARLDVPLRRLDTAKLEELDPYIRVATYGLFQLPVHRDSVFRGATLSDAAAAKYVPGAVIREHTFVSAVANPAIRFPGNTTFVIASINGREVWWLSDHPEEGEVVFFTGTRFKVLDVEVDETTRHRTVYLAEIPDPRLFPPSQQSSTQQS